MRSRSRDRQYLPPTAVMGRALTCTSCGTLVDLIEIPRQTIDPGKYTCGECMVPVNISMNISRPELLTREPFAPSYGSTNRADLGAEIKQYVETAFGSAA